MKDFYGGDRLFTLPEGGRPPTGSFTIIGLPIPQGNKTAFAVKKKGAAGTDRRDYRAVMREGRTEKTRDAHKSWRDAVAREAATWCRKHGMPAPIDGPLELWFIFFMPRPKSAAKRVQYPATRPDWDKLARSAGDSLSKIIYTDDARVVDAHVSKRFAIGRPPGAEIRWLAL